MSSFISYAQNFEDVMLWRALKHIEKGFYIDIGANDPEIDSVTKVFYDAGWRGINIEPIPQWYQKLKDERLRDINLQLAVGNETGEITLFEIPDTGLSTADELFAERHVLEHGFDSSEFKVPMDTLTNICERYHTSPIHFLKIDVEGMEKAVLEGVDFKKLRPWIVLLESMLPNVQQENHNSWEYILLNAGYKYAYSDGVNRFYVASERSELLDAFRYPPNVFDDFLLRQQVEVEVYASNLKNRAQEENIRAVKIEAQLQETIAREEELRSEIELLYERNQLLQSDCDSSKAKIEELNHSSNHWWTLADGLKQELNSVYRSKSWRVTWPLRKLMQLFTLCLNVLLLLSKRSAQWLLTHTISFVQRHDRIKDRAIYWLSGYPKLDARLRSFARARGLTPGGVPVFQQVDETDNANGALTPRGRRIYFDLKSTIQARKERKS